jgi:hypothetical protein
LPMLEAALFRFVQKSSKPRSNLGIKTLLQKGIFGNKDDPRNNSLHKGEEVTFGQFNVLFLI